jgi:hypothetical protein
VGGEHGKKTGQAANLVQAGQVDLIDAGAAMVVGLPEQLPPHVQVPRKEVHRLAVMKRMGTHGRWGTPSNNITPPPWQSPVKIMQ